jgi:DNA-binding XRE family transcriptional regulator
MSEVETPWPRSRALRFDSCGQYLEEDALLAARSRFGMSTRELTSLLRSQWWRELLQHSTSYNNFLQLMSYNNPVRCLLMEVNVEKLVELRINQGLSQNRLAHLSGVSQTAIWKIEQGGGANPATLKKLADVLGVKPVDLLRDRG